MFCAGFDKGGTDACQVSVLVCLGVWDSNYGPLLSDMSLCLSALFKAMLVFSAYNLSAIVCPVHISGCLMCFCVLVYLNFCVCFTKVDGCYVCLWTALILCGFRETAVVLLWQTTACLRPVDIVCWGWWAGEQAVPWQRSPVSTPKCPDFCPGYRRPWGWETAYFLFAFLLSCCVVLVP